MLTIHKPSGLFFFICHLTVDLDSVTFMLEILMRPYLEFLSFFKKVELMGVKTLHLRIKWFNAI